MSYVLGRALLDLNWQRNWLRHSSQRNFIVMKNVMLEELIKYISWKIVVDKRKVGNMSSGISQLTDLGQSIWYDNLERRILANGELAMMIHCGDIRGLTSNPSIFNNAIAKSKDNVSLLVPS